MKQEDYERSQRKRLAKLLHKETGRKYTTVLREVEAKSFEQVQSLISVMTTAR